MNRLAFLLLALHSLLPSAISSYYVAQPSRTKNLFRFNCRLDEALNDPQDGIEWLFNGSDYRSSPCFAGADVAANRISFNHSSDCDGYIQCGNGTEYSDSIQLIADPEHTPFFQPGQIDILRPQGSSVTLPCNIIVSAIGGLNVRWIKNAGTPDEEQVMSLNEDYSVTLTNLELTSISIFYRCEVITTSGVVQGQVFSLKVVPYSPPRITEIVPSNDDEDEIEIVLSSSGTNLNFSWFLDGIKLNNGIDGVEIDNEINFQSNGASKSTLELSRRLISGPKNLTGIASNTDTTNSSDLRGMGSEVVRNRSDSAQLWLYPVSAAVSSTPIPTQTITPTSESLCNQKVDVYMALFLTSIAVVLVLVLIIVAISVFLCYKSQRNRNSDKNGGQSKESSDSSAHTGGGQPSGGNQYVQQCSGCIGGFTVEQRKSVSSFILKLTSFIGDIGSQQYTSEEVKLLALKITHYLSEVTVAEENKSTRQVKPDGPSEEMVFDGAHNHSSSVHHYEEIPGSSTKPAELQYVPMLGTESTTTREDDFIKNMFEGIDIKTVCKVMSECNKNS